MGRVAWFSEPPDAIAGPAVRFVLRSGCAVVMVLSQYDEPVPTWLARVRARATHVRRVPAPHSEMRVGNGFLSGGFKIQLQSPDRVAYYVPAVGAIETARDVSDGKQTDTR